MPNGPAQDRILCRAVATIGAGNGCWTGVVRSIPVTAALLDGDHL